MGHMSFLLDKMGHMSFLLDEMGYKMGLDEMG